MIKLISSRFSFIEVTIFIVIVSSALSGCATPARSDLMTVSQDDIVIVNRDTPLTSNVSINKIIGGKETNPGLYSEIGENEFRESLVKSLKLAGLYNKRSDAEYSLDVVNIQVNEVPGFVALNFTRSAVISYKLKRLNDGKILFNQNIATSHTVTLKDAIWAVDRIQVANEGVIKKNITELINRLLNIGIK